MKPLVAVRDSSFGGASEAALKLTTHVLLASFEITASNVQDVQITKLSFDKDNNKNLDLKNVVVLIDDVQFGTTRGGVADSVASMDFSGSRTVTAGSSIIVSVYADIQASSTAGTHLTAIDLKGWTANGVDSGTAIAFSGEVLGQDVVLSIQ